MPTHPLRAADIAGQLRSYLDTVQRQLEAIPTLETLAVISTRSAGAIGLACSIAMRSRGSRGPTTRWKATSRDASPSVADHRPAGANAADAATRGRLGTPPHPPTEAKLQEVFRQTLRRTWRRSGNVLLNIASVSAGRAVPETDSSAIRSTTSAVVSTPGYRHRVTFAALRCMVLLLKKCPRCPGTRGFLDNPVVSDTLGSATKPPPHWLKRGCTLGALGDAAAEDSQRQQGLIPEG